MTEAVKHKVIKTVMGDVGNFVNLLDPSTICWSYGAGSEGNGGIL